jgi:hypothetical protein
VRTSRLFSHIWIPEGIMPDWACRRTFGAVGCGDHNLAFFTGRILRSRGFGRFVLRGHRFRCPGFPGR